VPQRRPNLSQQMSHLCDSDLTSPEKSSAGAVVLSESDSSLIRVVCESYRPSRAGERAMCRHPTQSSHDSDSSFFLVRPRLGSMRGRRRRRSRVSRRFPFCRRHSRRRRTEASLDSICPPSQESVSLPPRQSLVTAAAPPSVENVEHGAGERHSH
jgi:hypothetical protein